MIHKDETQYKLTNKASLFGTAQCANLGKNGFLYYPIHVSLTKQ